MLKHHFDIKIEKDCHHPVEWKTNFCIRVFIIIWFDTLLWIKWIPAYGALFHSWYVMLRFVQNMKIFCSEDLFWFQGYWDRDIFHRNVRLLLGYSMVVIRLCLQIWTSVSHVLKGLNSNCDIWLVSSYIVWIVMSAECGAGNAHSFWNIWFWTFCIHDFTLSLYALQNLSVLWLCLWINDWFVCLD